MSLGTTILSGGLCSMQSTLLWRPLPSDALFLDSYPQIYIPDTSALPASPSRCLLSQFLYFVLLLSQSCLPSSSVWLLLLRIFLKGIPSASQPLLQLLGKIPTPESPPFTSPRLPHSFWVCGQIITRSGWVLLNCALSARTLALNTAKPGYRFHCSLQSSRLPGPKAPVPFPVSAAEPHSPLTPELSSFQVSLLLN